MCRILTIFLFSILISQSRAEKSVHLGVWSQFSEVPGKPNTYLAEIPSSKSVKRLLLPSSSPNIIKIVIDKKISRFEHDQELKEKFQEAKWLIKNLSERSISILRVTKAIMKNQIDFLEKGELYIKPLSLKNIAYELELHESTISRISSNKFISTPHGIYEIKFFFNNSISGDNKDISSKSITHKIKTLIEKEDANKPYSDAQICNMLNKLGINISRRTIAKYRLKLKILPSNQRKV